MTAPLPIEIDCRSVKSQLDDGAEFILVDCREPDEHAVVHIEAATLLPMSQFAQRAAELDSHRASHVVVHCHHGGRSRRVVEWLRQQGFEKAQSMAGGIDQWAVDIDSSLPRY
ncbi:MAG: rhodanese-like domain-containing protein [Pirellulales bacterium]